MMLLNNAFSFSKNYFAFMYLLFSITLQICSIIAIIRKTLWKNVILNFDSYIQNFTWVYIYSLAALKQPLRME